MEKKWFLKSKTIVGGLITIIPVILNMVGIQVSPEEAATASLNIQDLVVNLVQLSGFLMMIYGRFTADTKVTVTPNG